MKVNFKTTVKKLFGVLVLATMIISVLISCQTTQTPNPEKLTAPTVVLNENEATWEANPKAERFEISVNNNLSYIENSITSKLLEDGQTFKIRAIGDGTNYSSSEWSNAVTYYGEICTHNLMHSATKNATCTEVGQIEFWYCELCGRIYSDEACNTQISRQEIIVPAVGHSVVIDPAVDPTDMTPGLTEGSHCSVCNQVFVAQQVIYKTEGFSITYSIVGSDTYLAQQTIVNSNPTSYHYGQETIVLSDLSAPAGYEFLGWYDAPQAAGGTRVTEIAKGTSGNKSLYAHWKEIVYDITYKLYQTPLGAITEERYLHYTVSKGLKDLPNPEINNYVFLGWYTDNGEEMDKIPVGITGDITLNAYWTSKRNLTKVVKSLGDPIIIEDSDSGVLYFTYELGSIENVPLSDAIWTIQSVSGLAQQKSETVSITISQEKAMEIADTISKSTVDSATWTLSEDWNDVTSVSEEWAAQQGMTVEEANQVTKSESGTISITTGNGGCSTTTETDGTTTVTYDSKNETRGNSAEFNIKVNGSYSAEAHADLNLEVVPGASLDVGASSKWEIGGEVGGGYEQHKDRNEHTGTDTTKVDSKVTTGSTSWNNSKTSSETKSASQSESVSKALSEIISNTKGYGKSYTSGGENSESQAFSSTDSKSVSSSSSLTYFSSETKTTTTTYSTDGKSEGCYRLVIAGTVHVFGVVGYDVATQSYFTYTFNVLDDKTYEFLDYSPTLSFDDYENGALPFEIPYFVHEYVTSKTVVTESLTYTTDSTTGTAVVTNFGENVGTKEVPNWVYPTLDVVVPSYISSGGNAYKVTGIASTAFSGKPIRSIILSDYITDIPANAFKNCTSLEQISGRFTTIGDNAFSGCTALEGFTVSGRTTSIGKNAFYGVTTLKVNALNVEYAPTNSSEITQNVVQSAVESGAKNVIINISKIATNTILTLNVPAIDSFELIGDKTVTYTDLKIVSLARTIKIRNLTVANCTRIPLEIKDGDIILDTVNITAPSFVLLLAKDSATISLLRDGKLTSESGNTVVAKNPQIESLKDENVWGSLRISGNFYYCGNEPDTTYMTIDNGNLISLTETEFAGYIQGCFKITFNPNGGSVNTSEKTAFVGQRLGTLPTPTRENYSFTGWYDENGHRIDDSTVRGSATSFTVYAQWAPKQFTLTYNANGGSVSTTSKTLAFGDTLGTLPTPTRDYYNFLGWFDANGHEVTSATKPSSATNLTITAKWQKKEAVWGKASELPSGAEVLERKWKYTKTETKESYETSLDGWTQTGSRWVEVGYGTSEYASFPTGYLTTNSFYTSMNKAAYEAYETATTKRVVVNTWAGYIYWHYMYNTEAKAYYRCIRDKAGTATDYNNYVYKNEYFRAFKDTVSYTKLGKYYDYGSGTTLVSCGVYGYNTYLAKLNESNSKTSGSCFWYRFDYYTSTYTDYQKVFTYQKVTNNLESKTAITNGGEYSNVVEWVKYIPK